MKAKHLIIVSLLLAVLTIGAVSASEDVAVDDAVAASDVTEDPIDEAPVDEVIEQSDDSEPALEIEPDDFNVNIKDSIDLDDEDQNVINYTAPEDADGDVLVYVDYMDWPSHTDYNIEPGNNYTVSLYQLNIERDDTYHIEVGYFPSGGDYITLAQKSLKVTKTYDAEDFNPYWNGWVYDKFVGVFSINSPTRGTLIVAIGDKRFNATVDEYDAISVELSDLNITSNGIYALSAKFIVDSSSQEVDLGQKSVHVDVDDWDADRYVEVRDRVYIEESDSTVAIVRAQDVCINGTVTVDIDGDTILTKGFTEDDSEYYLDITLDDLGLYNNITAGDYTVKVVYMMNGVDKHEVVKSVEFYTYDPGDYNIYISYSVNVVRTNDPVVTIYDEGYIDGQVSVYVDGALKVTKNVAASQKEEGIDFTVADLNVNNVVGDHTVKVVYKENNGGNHELQRLVNFFTESAFESSPYISYGERAQYIINHIKGFKGTATLYKATGEDYDQKGAVYGSASFVDGVAIIYLTSLPEGNNYFILNVTGDDEEHEITVHVMKNTPGISASVTPTTIETGNSVTLKLNGPKDLNQNFYVYIDGVMQDKPLNFFNLGTISQSYKFTTTGTHAIKVSTDEEDSSFYSNTFYVTVKAKQTPAKKANKITLTLKKVKVKKSAKKLVLQATLKINGKAVKGKVIKFKFNKKTYRAKTNKKGVAKVTIKKKVLKKLKVGKKVKYQATYGKVTKKVTVKVKK